MGPGDANQVPIVLAAQVRLDRAAVSVEIDAALGRAPASLTATSPRPDGSPPVSPPGAPNEQRTGAVDARGHAHGTSLAAPVQATGAPSHDGDSARHRASTPSHVAGHERGVARATGRRASRRAPWSCPSGRPVSCSIERRASRRFRAGIRHARRLTPYPSTTCCSSPPVAAPSARIPAIFRHPRAQLTTAPLRRTTMSFGHLIAASMPHGARSPSATATPAVKRHEATSPGAAVEPCAGRPQDDRDVQPGAAAASTTRAPSARARRSARPR